MEYEYKARVRSLNTKLYTMDDDLQEERDDSRPFYQRKTGRIGLYLEIYEARAERPKEFGSEHFFMMSLKEKMAEYLNEFDLVRAKGFMEKKNVCKGVILEKIQHGLVLTLAFDNLEAIESMWKIHTSGKLTPLVQDIFVDDAMLKVVGAVRVTLQAKLWEDEYTQCKAELLSASLERLNLKKTENGVTLVKRLRLAQKNLQKITSKLRDEEANFDQDMSEFLLNVKKILPTSVTAISTLKEFQTNIKMAKGTKEFKPNTFETIDQYFHTLELMRGALAEVEKTIWYPLIQIHSVCENAHQKTVKQNIKDTHADTVKMLKIDYDIQKVTHSEWELKILFRERRLFLSLVCLVPVVLERILDIDNMLDEYITDFPDKIRF